METQEPKSPETEEKTDPSPSADGKKSWEEPKLAFVEPKLTRHGNLEKITRGTNGFFGQFSP